MERLPLLMSAFISGGLNATYFETSQLIDFDSSSATVYASFARVDAVINFSWGSSQPIPASDLRAWPGNKSIGQDYFSVRWAGYVRPRFSETYTIVAVADDGIRVRMDGISVLNFWNFRSSEVAGTIALSSGILYPVEIDYRELTGNATIQIFWSSASQQREIIPSSHLYRCIDQLFDSQAIITGSNHSVSTTATMSTAGDSISFSVTRRDFYPFNFIEAFHENRVAGMLTAQASNFAPSLPSSPNVFSASVDTSLSGSLTATYYSDNLPVAVHCHGVFVGRFCSLPWGSSSLLTTSFLNSRKVLNLVDFGTLIPTSNFSVRYRGFIKPSSSGDYTFEFSAAGFETQEIVLFDSDGVIVSPHRPTSNLWAFSLQSNSFYDIQVRKVDGFMTSSSLYKSNDTLNFQFSAASFAAFPTDRMFPISHSFSGKLKLNLKGVHELQISSVLPGGLSATYYENDSLSSPVSSKDMVAAELTSAPLHWSDYQSFSVRWNGLVSFSAPTMSFVLMVASKGTYVRVWIDGVLVVDSSFAASSSNSMFSVTPRAFQGASNPDLSTLFDLKIDYIHLNGPSAFSLNFENGSPSIPSTSLFFRSVTMSLPSVSVAPAPICASLSSVSFPTRVMTAGIASTFELVLFDMFFNSIDSESRFVYVRLDHTNFLEEISPIRESSTSRSIRPTKSGIYTLIASAMIQGKIALLSSSTSPSVTVLNSLSNVSFPKQAQFRLRGFIQPMSSGSTTISVNTGQRTNVVMWFNDLRASKFVGHRSAVLQVGSIVEHVSFVLSDRRPLVSCHSFSLTPKIHLVTFALQTTMHSP
jgi:hypothetical protein